MAYQNPHTLPFFSGLCTASVYPLALVMKTSASPASLHHHHCYTKNTHIHKNLLLARAQDNDCAWCASGQLVLAARAVSHLPLPHVAWQRAQCGKETRGCREVWSSAPPLPTIHLFSFLPCLCLGLKSVRFLPQQVLHSSPNPMSSSQQLATAGE